MTKIYGTTHSDHLDTRSGDVLYGLAGNDFLDARNTVGNDTLYGGDGNDVFFSGPGNDTFYGGAGADSFFFYTGEFSDPEDPSRNTIYTAGNDIITDFKPWRGDKLEIEHYVGVSGVGEHADSFVFDKLDSNHNGVLDKSDGPDVIIRQITFHGHTALSTVLTEEPFYHIAIFGVTGLTADAFNQEVFT